MLETKTCNHCKLTLPVNEFTTRKINTKDGSKIKVTNLCKNCNCYKSKLYYCYKKEHAKNNNKVFLYRFICKKGDVLYIGKTDDLDIRLNSHIYRREYLYRSSWL